MTILKNKHKIIGFILTIVLVLALFIWVAPTKVSAEVVVADSGTCGENLTWQLTYDDAVEVVEYTLTISGTGAMTEFGSPDDIPWVSYASDITSVVINEGVTSIGNYAFSDCFALTAIEIPKSVTYIGSSAFSQTALSDIRFKSATPPTLGVTEDGISNLFGVIDMLPTIYVPAYAVQTYQQNTDGDWENYASQITAWVIQRGYCGGTDDMPISFEITEYSENDEYVLTISGTGAMVDYTSSTSMPWNSCKSSIISVVIENGVTTIGDLVFDGCSGLTSITIPESVKSIGYEAFAETNISTITIPSSVAEIGESAFEACANLKNVSFEVPNTNLKNIGNRAFAETALTSIQLPNNITDLGTALFKNCKELKSVTISSGVTTIPKWTFYGCRSLGEVNLNGSLSTIEDSAFYGCFALTSTDNLLGNATSIGRWAFYGCTGLTSVTIPSNVISIGENAFAYCFNLKDIDNQSAVTLTDDMFIYCIGYAPLQNDDSSSGNYSTYYGDYYSIMIKEGYEYTREYTETSDLVEVTSETNDELYVISVSSSKPYENFADFATQETVESSMTYLFNGYVDGTLSGHSYNTADINGYDTIYLSFNRTVENVTYTEFCIWLDTETYIIQFEFLTLENQDPKTYFNDVISSIRVA